MKTVIPKARIYTLSGVDPGIPVWGGANSRWGLGANLRRGCFLAKMYVKTKELGPVGGTPETFICRSATAVQALC